MNRLRGVCSHCQVEVPVHDSGKYCGSHNDISGNLCVGACMAAPEVITTKCATCAKPAVKLMMGLPTCHQCFAETMAEAHENHMDHVYN